jgi:hypothetical protein
MNKILIVVVFSASILALFEGIILPRNVNAEIQSLSTHVTSWKVVNKSMSDLLNSGWRIVSQSAYRVATSTSGGFGSIDEETFIYTIVKDGKFITCIIPNPQREPGVTRSGCRLLN